MDFVMNFWLPIVSASVAVFLASWLVWMVLPHHKSDYRGLTNEDEVMAAIRAGIDGPGQYQFPHVSDRKSMKDPEFLKRCEGGPVGTIVVWPGNPMKMGKSLVLHFLHTLVLAALVAFFCYRVLGFGAQYLAVLRLGGFVAVLAYVGASASQAIWFGRPWGVVLKEVADGVFYGLLLASVLAWLWPFAA